MALLDISYVTQSLSTLIETLVNVSDAWTGANGVKVSPQPPDQVQGGPETNKLALYLYHITEDPHFKNLPPTGADAPPIRYAPMGLTLYYQLTAHSAAGEQGTLMEQTMMGLAVKALHDYPVIDDSTKIINDKGEEVEILNPNIRKSDNRLRITLLPLSYSEAVNFWTPSHTPLRLAAYYEVNVVLLEPEPIKRRASRVLNYGVYPFVQGFPRLLTSENTFTFDLPGGSGTQSVTLQPAQVTYGGRVTFKGTGVNGAETKILLKGANWDEAVEVDAAWSAIAKPEEVSVVMRKSISRPPPDADIEVLPGLYSAQVKVVERHRGSDGSFRDFPQVSNATPFTVTPQIENVVFAGTTLLDITGGIFRAAIPPEVSTELYLGDKRLTVGSKDQLKPGEYAVIDATTMQVALFPEMASGDSFSLRVVANGAESHPLWVTVP